MRNLQLPRLLLHGRFILAAAFALASIGTSIAQTLKGVNLSGAEFSASTLPGRYGWDYVYPNAPEIEYFTGKGMNVFRIPILWERLQPVLNGPLDPEELAELAELVADAHQHGALVVIDIHNYGEYRGIAIGHDPVTIKSFADLWTKLAMRFGRDDYVIFGLMNEPQVQQTSVWKGAVQQAIDGIRETGARNRILVSGINWDGAHSFVAVSGNSLGGLTDPQHRLVFEVHQYFDSNSSGTSDTCVNPDQAVERLTSFTQWLRASKRQGFLGEFGVSRRPECLILLDRVVSYLQANSEVWLGWTYWAAGPLWGDYMFTLEPAQGEDRPQMLVLQKYLHPEP